MALTSLPVSSSALRGTRAPVTWSLTMIWEAQRSHCQGALLRALLIRRGPSLLSCVIISDQPSDGYEFDPKGPSPGHDPVSTGVIRHVGLDHPIESGDEQIALLN